MFGYLFQLIQNIILSALLVSVFAHPPSFQILQNVLHYLHVIARVAFIYIRSSLEHSSSIDLEVFIKSFLTKVLIYFAPVLRPALPWATELGTAMVRLSPSLTCYMNSKMIEMGQYVVDLVMKDDGKEMIKAWQAVAQEVAGLCKTMDTGGSSTWFW